MPYCLNSFYPHTDKIFKISLSICLSTIVIQSTNAACFPNGTITSTIGQIILGSINCSDATPSTQPTVISGSLVLNNAGSTLIAPIVLGHDPWIITNQATATIQSTVSNAIAADGGPGASPTTLINAGTIDATTGSSGALLLGGANVTNQATGIISGAFTGLSISLNGAPVSGGPSSVNNAGIIQSVNGFNTGIALGLGGYVLNQASGLITGFGVGVQALSTPSQIDNYGIIGSNTTSTSVGLAAGGTVNNFLGGQLLSTSRGITVDGGPGQIENHGIITANAGRGIDFGVTSSGGTVNNYAGALISGGGTRSIIFEGGSGTVNNAGTVSGGSIAAIQMLIQNSSVNNSGVIVGNVQFLQSNDTFLMTAGSMTGQLLMGTLGNETATFQNVSDTNIGGISLFSGGGGGHDLLTFDNSSHTGGSDLILWETINLNNGSNLILNSNLTLGGNSADATANLNINASTLSANGVLNPIIQSNVNNRPVLVSNAGIIDISSPGSNNALTIRGNYVGLGGILNLNAVLNGDGSPADKLVIDGQGNLWTATGTTSIKVHNTTGTGALTTGDGILVVESINNASTSATAFNLSGPVRAGAYDYRLFKGGSDPSVAEDWFLRSTFIPPNPVNPLPIIGPEISVFSSVMPTTLEMNRFVLGTWYERIGSNGKMAAANLHDGNTLYVNGGWIRGFNQSYTEHMTLFTDPKITPRITGMQVGLDLFASENSRRGLNLLGAYVAIANAQQTVNGPVTNPENTAYIQEVTGSMSENSNNGGLYWTHVTEKGAYIDLVTQASFYEGKASSTRTLLPLEGFGTTESLELGYPFEITPVWLLEPQGQLLYDYAQFRNNFDSFSEVDLGAGHAFFGRAGLRLLHPMEIKQRLVLPYLRANFWSVLAGDRANSVIYANANAIASTAASAWAQLGAGITADLCNQFSVYAFVDDLVSIEHDENSLSGIDFGIGLHAYL